MKVPEIGYCKKGENDEFISSFITFAPGILALLGEYEYTVDTVVFLEVDGDIKSVSESFFQS